MHGIFGITGTPGTGKKSVARLVAESLGVSCVGINDFAKSHRLVGKSGAVDTDRLRLVLARQLVAPEVLHGHLLPYVLAPQRAERVVVLRCEPSVLRGRLETRGYPSAKVSDNVQAELIGLVYADAVRVFGKAKTSEVDTTCLHPEEAAKVLVEASRGRRVQDVPIDWMQNYDSGPKLRSLLPLG